METIFKDNAYKIWSMGYSVIPINPRSKSPMYFMNNWSQYADRLPTEEEINSWIDRAPAAGLAIVCGPASGIACIDIDDNKIVNLPIIPRSPQVRIGKKGEARFFKYSPWMKNFSIKGKIDFLANGRYIVLPPSIHPDTNAPYVWSGEYKTMADKDKMPDLEETHLGDMQSEIGRLQSNDNQGRNTKLTSIVSAAIFNGEPMENIIQDVLEYDLTNHNPPLFTDKTEQYFKKTRDEKLAAKLFVDNHLKSLGKITTTHEPQTINITSLLEKKEDILYIPVPKTEVLKKIQSTVLSYGDSYNESIALGASLGIMSMLVANRFILDTKRHKTCGNLYLTIVAPTGSGKNVVKMASTAILENTNLVTGYQKTSAAFVDDMSQHRERIYVVDEISTAFGMMKDQKNSHTADMCENLCDAFTSNGGVFLPSMSMTGKKALTKPEIMNPYLSIIGTTTAAGLTSSTNNYLVEKGLLPRFLFFKQSWAPLFDIDKKPDDYTFWLRDFFRDFHKEHPIIEDELALNKKRVKHRILSLTKEAQEYFNALYVEENKLKKLREHDAGGVNDFLVRKLELISRVALLDAISEGNLSTVSVENLKYAEKVFEFSLSCISEYVPIIFGSEYGKNRQLFVNYIKNKFQVTKNTIGRRFRNLPTNDRNKIINDLIENEVIMTFNETNTNGKITTYYKYIGD